VIPKEFKTRVVVSRDALLNQIKSASLFSGRTNEIKMVISAKKGSIEISSQNVDLGETNSNLTAEIKGEDTIVSFNYKFLAEGLGQIKNKEVIIELNGQDGPGVLKPMNDDSYIYVIMPIKGS